MGRETLAERRDALLEYVRRTRYLDTFSLSLSLSIIFLNVICALNSRARFIRTIVTLVWLIDNGHGALIDGVQCAISSTQQLSNRYAFVNLTI